MTKESTSLSDHGRPLPAARRMKLSPAGEVRALTRLLHDRAPDASSLWAHTERSVTMAELSTIEIIEPFIRMGDDGAAINLDEDTSRAVFALAWAKLERALIELNALYNESSDGQQYEFNKAQRILWETQDLRQAAEVIFHMTALPDEIVEDDPA